MRKIKSLKGKSLKKVSFVEINEDVVLPITTRSISEIAKIKYISKAKIPMKIRTANMEEIEGILKNHPKYNKKSIPLVQEFDFTSQEFIKEKERETVLSNVLDVIKFVDMDYEVEYEKEDGSVGTRSLWEDLGVQKGDWVSVAEYFVDPVNGLGMTEIEQEKLFIGIKEVQGDSVFEKIKKLESYCDRDMFEILQLMDKVEEIEQEKKDIEAE